MTWKDYDGNEVVIRQNVPPGARVSQDTYFTHPFVSRDSVSGKYIKFSAAMTESTVFEGMVFAAEPHGTIVVMIGGDDEETTVSEAKSSEGKISFTVYFTNCHNEDVDLIWKDYEGGEVIVRQNIAPRDRHGENSYFTHPFVARDSVTGQCVPFSSGSLKNVVFEGVSFGALPGERIEVNIGEQLAGIL